MVCFIFRSDYITVKYRISKKLSLRNLFLSCHNQYLIKNELCLDSRTEDTAQRKAFEAYMKNGGGWLGFHFAAFALTPSEYNADWNWYHNVFLGSGQYVSNTWHPTSAILRVEDHKHPVTKDM